MAVLALEGIVVIKVVWSSSSKCLLLKYCQKTPRLQKVFWPLLQKHKQWFSPCCWGQEDILWLKSLADPGQLSFWVFTHHSTHSGPLLQYSRKRHPSQEGTMLLPPDTPFLMCNSSPNLPTCEAALPGLTVFRVVGWIRIPFPSAVMS